MRTALGLLICAGAAQACPSCAAQLQSTGVFSLILAMMAVPVVVLCVVGALVARHLAAPLDRADVGEEQPGVLGERGLAGTDRELDAR